MKQIPNFILTIGMTSLMFACSQSDKKMENKVSNNMTDSISANGYSGQFSNSTSGNANGFISSSAAVETGKDSTRKFIRTADMKFKVKSVVKQTTSIEDIAIQFGGFVTYTNLNSTIDHVTTTAVSADSSLETIYFTVANSLILRVPNTKLDTALRTIATLIDYLDYRIIKADDVRLQLLANQMTQTRVSKSGERLTTAIDTKGKKLNETTNAEENLLNKQEQSDNAKIANLSLQDQINFSTINLSIYQRQTIKRELISNYKNIDAYQPSLGSRLKEAFKTGWEIFETIIVFITQLWGLILFAVVVYILYRMFGHKLKK